MKSSDFSTPLTMKAGCVPVSPRSGYRSSIRIFGMRRMKLGCPASSYSTVHRPPVAASTLERRLSFVMMVAMLCLHIVGYSPKNQPHGFHVGCGKGNAHAFCRRRGRDAGRVKVFRQVQLFQRDRQRNVLIADRGNDQVGHIFHAFFHANSKPAVMAAHHVHRHLSVFLQGRAVKGKRAFPNCQRDGHSFHVHTGPRPGTVLFDLHSVSLHGGMRHQQAHVHRIRRAAGSQLEPVFEFVGRVHVAVLQASARAAHHFHIHQILRVRQGTVQRHGDHGGRLLDVGPARFTAGAVRDGNFRQIRVVFFRIARRNRCTGKFDSPFRQRTVQRGGRHVDDPRLGPEHIDDDHARLLRGIAGHRRRVGLVGHRIFPSVHEHHAIAATDVACGRGTFGKCHAAFDATVLDGGTDFLKAREPRLLMLLHSQRAQIDAKFQSGKKRFLHVRGIAFYRALHRIHSLFQVQGAVAKLLGLDIVYPVFPAHHRVCLLDAVNTVFPLRCFFQIRHNSPP
uniref:Uncharacterized protein n=1 Tax=Myoviridae sp. ct5nJ10 TaxID=2825034 RepID=A0A8S5NU72_9CAUD|nr:MAG TPA: hypothetical protein [Myoviridae sp. ct5nJ10]